MQEQRSTNPHQKDQPGTPVPRPADESSAPQQRGRRTGGRKNGEGSYDVRPDGLHRWRGSYDGPDGRTYPKQLTAATPKALRAKVKAWQEELARGLSVAANAHPTVEEVVDRWLATKVNLRANTLIDYTYVARRIKAGLGGHQVKALTDAHIQAWVNQERKAGYAASTLIKTKAILHQVLTYAETRGHVVRNVVRLVNVPKKMQVDPDVYDRAQIDRLLATAAAPPPAHLGRQPEDLAALLAVHCWTGLRPSELLALKWPDIRWQERVIYAQRGLLWPEGVEQPVLSPMKNAYSRRQIPVPAFVLDALQAHREKQETLKELLGDAYDDWGLVFAVTTGTRIGQPMHERVVADTFEVVAHRAGLPRLKYYNLRHSYATMLLDAGVPLQVVSGLLGHASIKMTADVYGARAKRNTDVAGRYIAQLSSAGAAPALPMLPTVDVPALVPQMVPEMVTS